MNNAAVEKAVYRAIDRVNELLLSDTTVPKRSDTVLLGSGGRLDSMGFVNFIVALEEELTAEFHTHLSVVEQLHSRSSDSDEALTVGSLITWLGALIAARQAGGKN